MFQVYCYGKRTQRELYAVPNGLHESRAAASWHVQLCDRTQSDGEREVYAYYFRQVAV